MRKIIVFLSAICLLIGFNACKQKAQTNSTEENLTQLADNSQNSLDWNGVYKGVIPCADCDGIEVTITLNADNTYQMSELYQGKGGEPIVSGGAFEWTADGGSIILKGVQEGYGPNRYIVGENKLIQLDLEGNVITGELADNYILAKQD